jgi:hypothetical protein
MNKTYALCKICSRNFIDVSDKKLSYYHAGATQELNFVCEGCKKPIPKEFEKYAKRQD